MLRVSPVVMRLVVERIKCRDKDQQLPIFLEGPVHIFNGWVEVKDVLQHVEANDNVIPVAYPHFSYVKNFMAKGGVNVCALKFVAAVKPVPDRINMLAIDLLA